MALRWLGFPLVDVGRHVRGVEKCESARRMRAIGENVNQTSRTKPTSEFSPARLLEMAESGCKYLLWGLESASQRVLDLMDKGSKVEEVSRLMKRCFSAGIANHVFMICGFPTETVEEFAQTIRFLDDHKDYIFAVHRGTFSLEPESPIFAEQKRFGITRSWLIKDTPTGGRWGYEVASGMSREQAAEVFTQVQPFLRAFNPYARFLANNRDHALLIYSRLGERINPQERRFPSLLYKELPPAPWADALQQERSLMC